NEYGFMVQIFFYMFTIGSNWRSIQQILYLYWFDLGMYILFLVPLFNKGNIKNFHFVCQAGFHNLVFFLCRKRFAHNQYPINVVLRQKFSKFNGIRSNGG